MGETGKPFDVRMLNAFLALMGKGEIAIHLDNKSIFG
jgi:hypothetical protein